MTKAKKKNSTPKKKTAKKDYDVLDKYKKVKEPTLQEKTLMSYTKEQLVSKIEELREVVKELETEKENFSNTAKAAKDYYLQETIFSKKFSTEILYDTSKLFNIPSTEI